MITQSFAVRRSLLLFLTLILVGITGCTKEEEKKLAENESGIPGVTFRRRGERSSAKPADTKRTDAKRADAKRADAKPNAKSSPILQRLGLSGGYRTPSRFTAPTLSRNRRDTSKDVYPDQPMDRKEHDKRYVENYYVGIDVFLKRNKVKGEKAKELRAAIESIVRHWRSGADLKTWETLYENYWGLLDEKLKKDPYAGLILSVILMEQRDYKKAKPLLFNVIMALKKTDYPALVAVWAHELHHVSSRSAGLGTDTNELLPEYAAATIYWVTKDVQLSASDDRFVFQRIDQFADNAYAGGKSSLFYQVSERIIADTKAPKWVRAMLQALHQDKLAWRARGNGFANQVTKEGWTKFRKHHAKAADYYKKALKICPVYPEPCYCLMGIARNGNDGERDAEHWFNKAIEVQYDYQHVYDEMLFGLLPRWGGSTEKLLDFGRQCYEEGQYDTLVPFQFIKAWQKARSLSMDLEGERRSKIIDSKELATDLCDCMKQIVDNHEKNGTMTRNVDYYRTYLAYFARRAGKHRLAVAVFKKMGPRYDKRAQRELGLRESPAAFQAFSYAAASEFESYANDVVKLAVGDREQRMKNADELIELADEMLESSVTAKSLSYFRNVRETTSAERSYDKGEVVSLKFNEDLSNVLSQTFDQLRFVDEDTIEINTQSGTFRSMVTLKPRFPGAKIIELDIESKTPQANRHRLDTWGIVPGKLNGGDAVVAYNAFTSQIKFGGTYYPTLIHYALTPKRSKKVSLKIYAGPRYLEVHVDGQFLMRTRPGQLRMNSVIALCHPFKQVGRGVVHFSNLKIQKWTQGPPPIKAEELIEYYDKAIDKDAKNGWNYLWRAHLFHLEKDYEQALEYYEKSIELGADRTIAGFYAGDCCERLDRIAEALKYYEEIVYDKSLFKDLKPMAFDQKKKLLHPLPAHHVLARYGWHRLTTPGKPGQAEQSDKPLPHRYSQLENLTPKWVRARLRAEMMRANDNSQRAQIVLENALVDVPLKYEEAMMKQIDSIKSGKPFTQAAGKSFYLDNVELPKYFPHFDTRLPRNWYHAYH